MCFFKQLTMFLFYFLVIVHSRVHDVEHIGLMNDKNSLVSFMSYIISDPVNVLESWKLNVVHICDWSGVKCKQ